MLAAWGGLSMARDLAARGRRWHRWVGALALLLAAAAAGAAVGLAWVAYLNGRSVSVFGLRVAGTPGAGPALPEGAVIAVLGETCPSPWRAYPPAQGRFLIGAGASEARNLDADGVLLPVRRPGETGGESGVELRISDLPPHTHRLALAEVAPGQEGRIAFAIQRGVAERPGVFMPFALKTSTTIATQGFTVLAPLETVGGIFTSDRRFAARRHNNVPPFVALTFCLYAPGEPLMAASPR